MKPILVNRANNVLIAGHQRTKAMREIGLQKCMCFYLDNVNQNDERRFNQYHNKCEYEIDPDAPKIKINQKLQLGINEIERENVIVQDKGRLAELNKILSVLCLRYGEFGLPIADIEGNVHVSSAYLLSARNAGVRIRVLVLDDTKIELAKYYLQQDYGEFCYNELERTTYIQSLAQMHRLNGKGNKEMRSRLYEYFIFKFLKSQKGSLKMLDFGAGEYAYAELLSSNGYIIDYVDPYHKECNTITVQDNTKRFLKICRRIETSGLYDVVICDSVLNSTDSLQAWQDVVITCCALLKKGGTLFISGRPLVESVIRGRGVNNSVEKELTSYFLDKHGFSAQYRRGGWFYQKFDTEEDFKYIVDNCGKLVAKYVGVTAYRMQITKTKDFGLDYYLPSVMREFDLQLPKGKSYGLHEQIKSSLTKAYENQTD